MQHREFGRIIILVELSDMFKYLKACVGAVIAITSTLSMAGCNPKEEDSQQPTKYGSVPVMYCNYQFNQFYSEMCFKNIDYYDRIHGNPMSSHYVDEGNPVFSENEEKFREDLIYGKRSIMERIDKKGGISRLSYFILNCFCIPSAHGI